MHLVFPLRIFPPEVLFPNSPGYYNRPKRNRKQWLCKVLGAEGKQGALWSM